MEHMNHQKEQHSCCSMPTGKGDHHKMMIRDFKKRFWISLILTVPVIILSPMIQELLHYTVQFNGRDIFLWIISTIIFFYGGWPFLKGCMDELKQKAPGMMTLIAMAIIVAYGYSSLIVFYLQGQMFFWELATLIDIMLVGHWIEMRSVLGASKSLELLVKMMPSVAHLVKNDNIEDVKVETLNVDDVVLVKPGEQMPADGIVIEGMTYVNEAMLTGESLPVKKEVKSKVIGGSINGSGSIKIKILHTGKDSYLSKVISLVEEAQKAKSKTQKLADRAAKWLTYVALTVGVVTFFAWILVRHDVGFSLERMVTVMIISCPHALGLAIPLVAAVSTTLAARHGILIRNRTSFENARKITTLLFDKTGTLTKGKFGVKSFTSLVSEYSKEQVLQVAAALEIYSEHPIAQGIIEKIKEMKLTIPKAEKFQAMVGEGIEGQVDKQQVKVVSYAYLQKKKELLQKEVDDLDTATTTVYVLSNEKLVGKISLADEIRTESFAAIETLKQKGIKTFMVTGDNEKVAKEVASKLQLDGYFANILPHEKSKIVQDLQKKGEFVAMTGDGVNDAPALATADVGIAIGSGTDVAAETADIILVSSNPKDIISLLLFARATYNKMIQNLFWAAGYNIFAIPLAAGVLADYGILISPALGAALMSLSTVIVAVNARLLK